MHVYNQKVSLYEDIYLIECCLHVCLSICGSHNSSAWNNGSSLGQLWYVQHQIKSKQVHGKWDGPWRADTLIWNQDNFSDSVYTTFVYWYKNSFCLQNKCYMFQLLYQNQTKILISHHLISNMAVRSHALQHLFMYIIITFSALQLYWCIYYIILYGGKST